MGTYDQYETDEKVEREGVWIDYGEAGKFRVARIGGSNSRFNKLYTKHTRPFRKQIQAGTMTEAASKEILRKSFIEGALLTWEGVTDRDGEVMPFSKENADKLFSDLPDLFMDLVNAAQERQMFLASLREEDSKNS